MNRLRCLWSTTRRRHIRSPARAQKRRIVHDGCSALGRKQLHSGKTSACHGGIFGHTFFTLVRLGHSQCEPSSYCAVPFSENSQLTRANSITHKVLDLS